MSGLLPPSTNRQYRGSPWSAWFTVLLGLGWIGPGLVHYFLPDGGAGSIAGIDLSVAGPTIVRIFAWAGATQLVHGLTLLLVGLRYRSLVPLMLLLTVIERGLLAWSAWGSALPPGGHHPPEHYGSLVTLPLAALFLWLSLRRQR